MRTRTAGFDAAVRSGGQRVNRCRVKPAGGSWTDVDMVSYQVTADRGQVARYSGSVVSRPSVDRALVEPYGAMVHLRSGFLIGGVEELVDVATMRIDDVGEDPTGALDLVCFGLEKAIQDAQFRTPQIVQSTSAVSAITELLGVVPTPVSVQTARDAAVPLTVFDSDRWKAIDGDDRSLARALGCEVYADAAGTFIIRDTPTLDDEAVWRVDAGGDGVLVGYRAQSSRQGVYNIVVAASDQAGYENVIIGVDDNNPSSPTYIFGPFGEVVRQYRSPLLLTVQQALTAAAALLEESRGLSRTLSLSAVPNPALEPGDVVEVVFPDGALERHLIDQLQHNVEGAQSAETRTTSAIVSALVEVAV